MTEDGSSRPTLREPERRRAHPGASPRRARTGTAYAGDTPGTLVPASGAEPTRMVARAFGAASFEEGTLHSAQELASWRERPGLLWVDVTGLADVDALGELGRAFGLHALALEDVLDPGQRPKVEHYDGYTFVVLRVLMPGQALEASPVSLFLGDDFVLTLQNRDRGAFEPVRSRLRHGRGKIRTRGPDYLAYALIDAVVDHYYPVLEAFDDELERVEDAVLDERGVEPVDLTRRIRRDLRVILRVVWPAREALASLMHEDTPRLSEETRVYLRDCYDHLVQLQDMIESSREIAASLLEAYISRVSLRTNEVVRVLTLVATIFIPLTFITGIYGMNFNSRRSPLNMPELDWYWGYPFALLLMCLVAAGSLWYFRRKGWLGRP